MQAPASLNGMADAVPGSPALGTVRQAGEKIIMRSAPNGAPAASIDEESFTETGNRARQLLDARYAEARTARARIRFDLPEKGICADFSPFSDQELAAVALNRNDQFTYEESKWATGELSERARVALQPFINDVMHRFDRRGMLLAVNMLYNGMTCEVREALCWDAATMASSAKMLASDTKDFGPIDRQSVAQLVVGTRLTGRPIAIDFLDKGEDFNFEWSPLLHTPSNSA